MKSPTLPAFLLLFTLAAHVVGHVQAEKEEKDSSEAVRSVEQIAREARPSLVAITHRSRPGGSPREGSGFAVGKGLIATNLHVIGDARPIQVVTSEGMELTVTSVHASDRKLDLAILRVEEEEALPILELGDSSDLPDGLSVVAMGNPQGFRFSVVEGVVSATREIDGLEMIQLAIPIEPGNSGGPLLDRLGRVVGVPSMKSQFTDNIGFAMPVNALKLLLEKPNPIPMERWVTVGRLNPRLWRPVQEGATWRQRGATISVSGAGAGFGGRALCLHEQSPVRRQEGGDPAPYEVSVRARLDDESGAAGLVFASDGADRHYGFYPSGGQIRLTKFEGPDVFSWRILADVPVAAYRPGDWNHLRVVIDPGGDGDGDGDGAGATVTGFVNGEEVVRIEDVEFPDGKAGLCKFRQTEASFQGFHAGPLREGIEGDAGLRDRLDQALDEWLASGGGEASEVLTGHAGSALSLVEARAAQLEKRAADLRRRGADLHHQSVCADMAALLEGRDDAEIDLFHAGLLIAKLAQPDLDVESRLEEVEAMAEEIRAELEPESSPEAILRQMSGYLFRQLGFHGSRLDYYSRENSYLNTVLDDREGIPITLAVLYMELARRLGVERVVGLPLPGHFVVQHRPVEDESTHQIIDVFDSGRELTLEEARALVAATSGLALEEEHLEPADKRAILVRMLRNLIGLDLGSEDASAALPELDLLLTIAPGEASERLSRALLRYRSGHLGASLRDLEWILAEEPEGIHLDRIEALRARVREALGL